MLAGLSGEAGDVARASGCALMYDPERPETLAEAVRCLAATTPEGRLLFQGEWEAGVVPELSRAFDAALGRQS